MRLLTILFISSILFVSCSKTEIEPQKHLANPDYSELDYSLVSELFESSQELFNQTEFLDFFEDEIQLLLIKESLSESELQYVNESIQVGIQKMFKASKRFENAFEIVRERGLDSTTLEKISENYTLKTNSDKVRSRIDSTGPCEISTVVYLFGTVTMSPAIVLLGGVGRLIYC